MNNFFHIPAILAFSILLTAGCSKGMEVGAEDQTNQLENTSAGTSNSAEPRQSLEEAAAQKKKAFDADMAAEAEARARAYEKAKAEAGEK